jgi:hypothetical protein
MKHTRFPMLRPGLALMLCLLLAACAGPGGLGGRKKITPFADPAMTLQRAGDLAVPGQTTKAQVAAALGPANVVSFDSGFEVWVYRQPPAGPDMDSAEFVILFTPAGVVQKSRVRPAYLRLRG